MSSMKRCLFIDDDESLISIYREACKLYDDVESQFFSDASLAEVHLKSLAPGYYDLIVVDNSMRGKIYAGESFCHFAKNISPAQKILMITGDSFRVALPRDWDNVRVLQKPVANLIEVIQSYLE